MNGKGKNLLTFGIFNSISVFVVILLATIVLSVVAPKPGMIASGTGILILFILALSPVSCILGIVQGIRCWKKKKVDAKVCLILSIIGFLLFAVVIGFFWYVISRF